MIRHLVFHYSFLFAVFHKVLQMNFNMLMVLTGEINIHNKYPLEIIFSKSFWQRSQGC